MQGWENRYNEVSATHTDYYFMTFWDPVCSMILALLYLSWVQQKTKDYEVQTKDSRYNGTVADTVSSYQIIYGSKIFSLVVASHTHVVIVTYVNYNFHEFILNHSQWSVPFLWWLFSRLHCFQTCIYFCIKSTYPITFHPSAVAGPRNLPVCWSKCWWNCCVNQPDFDIIFHI